MSTDYFTSTFYTSILFRSRANPDAIAVSYGGQDVTYADFAADIERTTWRLQGLALPQTGPVVINVAHSYLHWLLIIATGRLGLVSVSAYDLNAPGLLPLLQTSTVLTDRESIPSSPRVIRVDGQWLKRVGDFPQPFIESFRKEDDPFRLIFSSGTTGTPKRILITHGQFQQRLRNIAGAAGLSPASRSMIMVGFDTTPGFQLNLCTWFLGGRAILPMPRQNVYRTIRQYDVNFIFMAPAQLSHIVDALPPDASPIPSLQIVVGGSALPPSISHKARRLLTPSLFVMYGSTETGSVTRAHAAVADVNPGATGYVLPGVEVQVVDEAGQPTANGSVGAVRIRSAESVTGYLDERIGSDGAEEAFQNGWFYPGDAGILSDKGMLSIVGRTRELMNLGGAKIAPGVIEEALFSCPGVNEIAAFSVDQSNGVDVPWVAVVQGEGFQQEALLTRYRERFSSLPPLNVAKIDSLPRNAMGKVLRTELRRLVKRVVEKTI